MNTLLELTERCEQATGPDRELDLTLCIALDTGRSTDPRNPGAARYTASIDAAVLLVPAGMNWLVRKDIDEPLAFANVSFTDANNTFEWNGAGWEAEPTGHHYGRAVSPALALVAAALRARDAIARSVAGDA